MIGGIDVRLPTTAGVSSIEIAVRAIGQQWPECTFENGVTGERYERYSQIPFGELDELFVYRDRESAAKWDADGAVPDVYNTMVHLIADDDLLTVVVDEKDAPMNILLDAIESALYDHVLVGAAELVGPAEREAA